MIKRDSNIILKNHFSNSSWLYGFIILGWLSASTGYAQNPGWLWGKSISGADWQSCLGIAVDPVNGDMYSTGFFQSTTDFDPGPGIYNVTALGLSDMFILKLDSLGNFIWVVSIGSFNGGCSGASIIINPVGRNEIYITGGFQGTADFDGGTGIYNLTASGSSDVFVLKLDASGGFIWAVGMGGGGNDYGDAITVDLLGFVYTTGRFSDVADFDPGSNVFNLTSAGYDDVFVSKLNDAGEFEWARSMGGSSSEEGYSIALDAENNVYTNGYFIGTADFDPGPGSFTLTSLGLDNGFISKLSSSGDFVWAKGIIGYERAGAGSINVDKQSGEVYMAGSFFGTFDFDPGVDSFNLTSGGGDWNLFILKLDGSGNFDWVKTMYSDNGGLVVGTIRLSSDFNFIYVAGTFSETVDFNPGEGVYNLTADYQDIFVARLDAEGDFLWAVQPMGDGNEHLGALALDTYCNVHVAGGFSASAFIFGTDTLASDFIDGFIAKLKGCPSIVTNPGDLGEGTLRDIIACSPSTATIGFALQPFSQITLTSGEIIIEKNITLSGTGVLDLTISGNNSSRIFQVLAGRSLTIKDLVLKDGAADNNGGAIYTKGFLTLENVLLQNNFENGIPKSMTLMSPGNLTVLDTVIIQY
jgi:hypothetical protein